MGWKFCGYAAIFNTPDKEMDVFLPSCFDDFLRGRDHLKIPMLNGHSGPRVGKWLHMEPNERGLLVVGEFNDGIAPLQPPFGGLSVTPDQARGSSRNEWGGKTVHRTSITEISLVRNPTHPDARILGPC